MNNGIVESGKVEQLFSNDYADHALNAYRFDEQAFNRYVDLGMKLANSDFNPNGDGHFNMTDDVMNEIQDYNDFDLGDLYMNMDPSGRRMLAFDGIKNRDQFIDYIKAARHQYKVSREEQEKDV